MNKQERNIVIGGVLVSTLATGGFCLSQGSIVSADDNYKTPIEEISQTVDTQSEVEAGDTINEILEKETKDELEEVDDNKELDETYDLDKKYSKGDIIVYNGVEYKAKWLNQGSNPESYVDWEEVVSVNKDGVEYYSRGKHYVEGNVVIYNEVKYKANHWTESIPGNDYSWSKI